MSKEESLPPYQLVLPLIGVVPWLLLQRKMGNQGEW